MRPRVSIWALALSLLVVISAALLIAKTRTLYIYAYQMDGVFQASSMEYRLASGNFPGRDFFPYLGLGPVYILFPGFLVLGRTVAAANASAHFCTFFADAFEISLIGCLILPIRRLRHATLFLVLALTGCSLLPPQLYFPAPGNSLRSVRGLIPFIGTGLVLLAFRRLRGHHQRVWVAGAIAGSCAAWSNDFGLPSCLALLLFSGWWLWRAGERRATSFFPLPLAAVAAFFLVLTLATAGHPLPLLHYNFKDVAGDQYWYFGNDPAAYRITDLRTALPLLPWTLLFVLFAAVLLWKRTVRAMALLSLVLATYLGALLPMLGGHREPLPGYLGTLLFTLKVILFFVVVQPLAKRLLVPNAPSRGIRIAAALVAALLVLACLPLTIIRYRKAVRQENLRYVRVPELGGYVDKDQEPLIRFARDADKPFFEEYWSLPSAVRRELPPLPTDSAIAALGSQRARAKDVLDHWNGYITTMRAGGFFSPAGPLAYVSWATNENWWFYGRAIHDFTPVLTMPNLIVWKRNPQPATWQPVPCEVTNSPAPGISIAGPAGFYDLHVHFRLSAHRWHAHVLAQTNTVVFHSDNYGFVSINPADNEYNVPAYVDEHVGHNLTFRFTPARLASEFTLQGCTAARITDLPPHVLTPTRYSQADVAAHHGYPESDLEP